MLTCSRQCVHGTFQSGHKDLSVLTEKIDYKGLSLCTANCAMPVAKGTPLGRALEVARAAATGVELPALMKAGRWKSSRMPARYTERQSAGRGAVARYYQENGG